MNSTKSSQSLASNTSFNSDPQPAAPVLHISSSSSSSPNPANPKKKCKVAIEGCQKCGRDDDHSHLLLCEACNDEYHTYCLDPPLASVPEGDFFCSKCKPLLQIFVNNNDQLDQKVASLSPSFTKRFGEIIWAAGGQGFGWWPACIYDPRLTVGGARKLALKNLGKKHLVYFFGCADAPFTVLTDQKCMSWEDGLMEELDIGKVAKTTGKNRATMFQWALQAAIAENDKPIESRLDWNHEEDPFIIPGVAGAGKPNNLSVAASAASASNKKRTMGQQNSQRERKRNKNNANGNAVGNNTIVSTRRSNRIIKPSSKNNKTATSTTASTTSSTTTVTVPTPTTTSKTNRQSMNQALNAFIDVNQIEETFDSDNDDQFFCKILRKIKVKTTSNNDNIEDGDQFGMYDVNIGFITLSKKQSTFADARKRIHSDLDDDTDLLWNKWKFYIPHLGPMSKKQETMFGSMYDMLMKNGDGRVGDGSSRYPLKVIIYDSL